MHSALPPSNGIDQLLEAAYAGCKIEKRKAADNQSDQQVSRHARKVSNQLALDPRRNGSAIVRAGIDVSGFLDVKAISKASKAQVNIRLDEIGNAIDARSRVPESEAEMEAIRQAPGALYPTRAKAVRSRKKRKQDPAAKFYPTRFSQRVREDDSLRNTIDMSDGDPNEVVIALMELAGGGHSKQAPELPSLKDSGPDHPGGNMETPPRPSPQSFRVENGRKRCAYILECHHNECIKGCVLADVV